MRVAKLHRTQAEARPRQGISKVGQCRQSRKYGKQVAKLGQHKGNARQPRTPLRRLLNENHVPQRFHSKRQVPMMLTNSKGRQQMLSSSKGQRHSRETESRNRVNQTDVSSRLGIKDWKPSKARRNHVRKLCGTARGPRTEAGAED